MLFQGNPSKSNIELRKENQELHSQIDALTSQHDADQRSLSAWQQRSPQLPTLPPDRLARLFTVHGLKFGRLTGGLRAAPPRTGDDGVKIYITPTDDIGDALKAAGSFVIEAFDPAQPSAPLVGRWVFDPSESRKLWGGSFLENGYVLSCPWDKRPAHPKLTVHVQFLDELTQATFTAEEQVSIGF